MRDSSKSISFLDCIAICTVLGFTLDDKGIGKLCRKHGLYTGKDPLDASYGFYLLHRSCHQKGGVLAKRLTKLLDERFAGIIREVRHTECGNDATAGSDEGIAAKLDSWTSKCPSGIIWALLTDQREQFQRYGVYLVHQVALEAFRDAQRKTTALEKDDAALAAARRDLQLSRNRVAQQRIEVGDLRKRLVRTEREASNLRAAHQRQQQRLSELEERPSLEARLRRRIRTLEHELGRRRPSECPGPVETRGNSNGEEEAGAQPLDVAAARSSRADATLQVADPTPQPGVGLSPCPLEDLRVAVVGGLDRLEPHYRRVVEGLGAQFLFHNGDCHGRCRVLKNVVCGSDIIVFVTRVNSHAALRVVRGLCRKSGKRFTAFRETSPVALTRVLREVA